MNPYETPIEISLILEKRNSDMLLRPGLDCQKHTQKITRYPSHRIFEHLYGVLNVGKK
jgi:hypothetical protein